MAPVDVVAGRGPETLFLRAAPAERDVSRGLTPAVALRPAGEGDEMVRQRREILTPRDLRDSDFPLRRYRPSRLEEALREASLEPTARRHYDFRAPFLQQLAPRLTDRLAGARTSPSPEPRDVSVRR